MTTNTNTRTALVAALEDALHLNRSLIAATTDATLDVEIAADALAGMDALPEAVALHAIMTDGPWWVRGTLRDADTDEPIGPATAAQIEASLAVENGIILVDADGDVVAAGSWAAEQGARRVWVAR